ncbi:MAG: TolC family protein [Planctomycetes bacterium]|nr:TolC family protein [Planctomycetota bacterium]
MIVFLRFLLSWTLWAEDSGTPLGPNLPVEPPVTQKAVGARAEPTQPVEPSLTRKAVGAPAAEALGATPSSTVASVSSLSDLIQQVLERNPEIHAARARWKAVIERYPQAVALPDPMVSYEYSLEEPVEIRFGQEFPYPGRRRLEGDLVSKEVEMARLEHEMAVRDAIARLKSSWYGRMHLASAIEVNRQSQDFLTRMVGLASARYALDKTMPADVLMLQARLAELSYDLTAMLEMDAAERAKMNTLMNRSPEADLPGPPFMTSPEVSLDLDRLYQAAVEGRQEIRLARIGVEKAETNIQRARILNKPTFTGELAYMRAEMDDPGFMVGVSVPLWGTRNRARLSEAQHERDAAALGVRALENETMSELKDVYVRWMNANRRRRTFEQQVIPKAEAAMEMARTWYREGQGNLTEFTTALEMWLKASLELHRAVEEIHKSLVLLEQIIGGRLPVSEPPPAGSDPAAPKPQGPGPSQESASPNP